MTDAEAQSAPPPAPVEDKLQAERKVIGGLEEVHIVPVCEFSSEKCVCKVVKICFKFR